MTDLMTDPRGQDLLRAATAELAALGDSFARAAARSQETAAGLQSAQQQATWTGSAADAYRHAIGAMTIEVATLGPGFTAAAQALSAYENEVVDLERSFGQVVAQLQEAEARLRETRSRLQQADDELRAASSAPHPDPIRVARAQHDVDAASAEVANWTDQVEQLLARGERLLEEFDQARTACRTAVGGAQLELSVPPSSV